MDDRIERSIDIHASLDRVWDLVTIPGWWVTTGSDASGDRTPGTVVERTTSDGQRYPVEVVKVEPQTYASYRWASTFPDADLADGTTTLIEFTVEEFDSFVRVSVVESGFATLTAPEDVRAAGLQDNSGGWTQELAALRERAQA